jgi:hypothetical protein
MTVLRILVGATTLGAGLLASTAASASIVSEWNAAVHFSDDNTTADAAIVEIRRP